MKIGGLARSLNVPVPTLRRWTEEFADCLQPGARGGDGRPRAFTPRDQRVLRRARDVLSAGDVTYAQARQILVAEGLLADAPAAEPAPAGPPSDEERDAAERFVARIVETSARPWLERIDRLEREVSSLRAQIATLRATPVETEEDPVPTRRRWPFG